MSYDREDFEELKQALESSGNSLDDPIILQELENIKARLEDIQEILDGMNLDIEDLEDLY
jgi:hypothetical protein